jgi:hypothetical protein
LEASFIILVTLPTVWAVGEVAVAYNILPSDFFERPLALITDECGGSAVGFKVHSKKYWTSGYIIICINYAVGWLKKSQ